MNFSKFPLPLVVAAVFVVLTSSFDVLAVGMNSPQPGAKIEIPVEFVPTVKPRSASDAQLLNLKSQKLRSASVPALDNQGLIDGVYVCDVTLDGKTERMLLTFNGKANGQTIYAVSSMKTYYIPGYTRAVVQQPFRGWGIGSLTTEGFVGTTWNGYPFSFTLLGLEESTSEPVYDVLRIAGNVGTGVNQTAKLTCKTDKALF